MDSPARRQLFTSNKELQSQKNRHSTALASSPRRQDAAPQAHSKHYSLRHFEWEKADHLTPICPAGPDRAPVYSLRSPDPAPGAAADGGPRCSQQALARSKARHATPLRPEPAPARPPPERPSNSAEEFERLKYKHATPIRASPRREQGPSDQGSVPRAVPSNRELTAAKRIHRVQIGGPLGAQAAESPQRAPRAESPRTRSGGYSSLQEYRTMVRKHAIGTQSPVRVSRPEEDAGAAKSQQQYSTNVRMHRVASGSPSVQRALFSGAAGAPAAGEASPRCGGHEHCVSHKALTSKKQSHAHSLCGPVAVGCGYSRLRDSRKQLRHDVKKHNTAIQASVDPQGTRRVTHCNGRPLESDGPSFASAADLHVATTTA
eukprot:TRINITY_DN65643_c0_g1_i1.p1 TRINITY_DN65643_c0_g1~~TRINITY_DN65643_c0_g1_i1.p1  ORF type:complete len:375 (+),score=101.59 TRINITY_DN65643_c0_g1_i1:90-1214(+)